MMKGLGSEYEGEEHVAHTEAPYLAASGPSPKTTDV